MIEWILILTLNSYGTAITDIPGFLTQQECVTAGTLWVQAQRIGAPNYACVPRTPNIKNMN